MSEKERVRMYTEYMILDCINAIDGETFCFSLAYELMRGALGAAELVQAVTAFEASEIRTSILESRIRYLKNKGGEILGI